MKDDLIFTPPAKRHFDPWAYVLLAPALVLLMVFLFLPALWAFLTGLNLTPDTSYDAVFSAYSSQLQSGLFWRAIINTLYFSGIYVPGALALGYVLARVLHRSVAKAPVLLLFVVPLVVPGVAVSFLWRWIFSQDAGLLNAALQVVGLPAIDWLGQAPLVLPSIALMSIWRGAGMVAIVFYVALRGLPKEFEELAEIEGACGWKKFVYLTLPALRPAWLIAILLLLINAHRVFSAIFVMTRDGGPANWATNLPFLIYRTGMRHDFDFSGASVISTMLCFTIALLVVLLRRNELSVRGGDE